LELVLEEFDYFENDIPFHQTPYSHIENHDEIAALGRILFYDTRLSQNNSISCASCHKQGLGFSDNEQFSLGVRNYETKRNAMTLVNNAYQVSHFWEGHPGEIEDHVLNPISNHIEMGMKNMDELVVKLSEVDEYNKLFRKVFYNQEISDELIKTALSTFVASIVSYNSKFDKGERINFTNFTIAEQEGKALFFGKAKCSKCHGSDHFSDSWRNNTNIGLDMEYEDQGAGNGEFKIPSLRNIALTNPYMHDGRFQTLEEVVNHYVNGINSHPNLDWQLTTPIALSELEQNQLIEFLHTLTDHQLISDEKFSDPFR
jgi:cytochrome c peroxidase